MRNDDWYGTPDSQDYDVAQAELAKLPRREVITDEAEWIAGYAIARATFWKTQRSIHGHWRRAKDNESLWFRQGYHAFMASVNEV